MATTGAKRRHPASVSQRIVGSFASVVFVVVTGLSSVPNLAVDQTGKGLLEKYVKTTLPQGWGFFTKSGKDPIIVPYGISGNQTHSISTSPVGQPKYAFGLSRTGRAQGIELGLLLKYLDNTWKPCDSRNSDKCLERADREPTQTIQNISPHPSVCGEVIFLETEPVPFHFRNLVEYDRVGIRYAVAHVECDNR